MANNILQVLALGDEQGPSSAFTPFLSPLWASVLELWEELLLNWIHLGLEE